ncbi:hypothetical protein RB195_015661 [Necator americanus]|uniref:G-protein coupled receptors family 1 profile domain-containing protein n=1 Tax=Necator americanus TaxID=51031 RepID=A0ABR1E621_NECAM
MNDTTASPTNPVITVQDYHLAALIIFMVGFVQNLIISNKMDSFPPEEVGEFIDSLNPVSHKTTMNTVRSALFTQIEISFLGTICNSLVAVFTHRLAIFNNAFGRLTGSQAIGEMILCAVFAFYYSPMVFFDITTMKLHSKHAGLILLMCYSICIVSHLFIALNRMCAICFPLNYDKWFSHRNTTVLIVISWVLSISVVFVLHGLEDCSLIFSDTAWVFVFKTNERCGFISWYIDFGEDFSIVVIIAIVDTVTIIKVRITAAEIAKSGCRMTNSKRAKDVNFLKQAVAQGVVFAVELFTYFFMGWLFTNKWAIFACTTMAWNIVHCSDP